MQTFVVLTLLSAAFTSAFVIPEGTPNGIYRTYTNENGTDVHELLSNAIAVREAADDSSAIPRYYDVNCGCGINLDHGSTDAAVQALKNQFPASGSKNQGSYNYFSIVNNVVAFSCLQDAGFTVSSRDLITNTLQQVTNRCGLYVAGTGQLVVDATAENAIIGYMVWYKGLDFCKAAQSSPKTSC